MLLKQQYELNEYLIKDEYILSYMQPGRLIYLDENYYNYFIWIGIFIILLYL